MRSVQDVHWKDWCWSWNSSTLATSCEELTHWKRPWCCKGLGAGGEGDDRGWDGWMASPTWWAWVWVNSGSWWWTGRPGVLRFVGSQRVGHDRVTELNWTEYQVQCLTHHKCWKLVAQFCPTLCDPMDCSPQVPLSMTWTQVSYIASGFFTIWATREALSEFSMNWTDSICLQVSAEGDLETVILMIRKWKWKVFSPVQLFATPWTDYTVHGIVRARILEWVAFPFSRGSSQPRDRTQVSLIAGGFLTSWATGKPKNTGVGSLSLLQQIFPHRNWTGFSCIAGGFVTKWAIRKAPWWSGVRSKLD